MADESRGDAAVAVMQSAEDGDSDELRRDLRRGVFAAGERCITAQSLVRPFGVIVVLDELLE